MPSAWIIIRTTTGGGKRYRVEWRVGGRESATHYGGSFPRKGDAEERKRWIIGELAAMRVPDIRSLAEPTLAPTLDEIAPLWLASRVDASENTRLAQRSSIRLACSVLGRLRVDEITPADVARLVAELVKKGRKRGTIKKAVGAVAMALDFVGVKPNPARDKVTVRLPREETEEINPPLGTDIMVMFFWLPWRYRLPLLIYDDTGMRLTELELLRWGDVDEEHGRWRVRRAATKTRRARWVTVHPDLFAAVLELCPREDRTEERRVFEGFDGPSFRTAVARACVRAGVPVFSPHDLRHRRISLMHMKGVTWAAIGQHVGQRNLAVTANTYTHVLTSDFELSYDALLANDPKRRERQALEALAVEVKTGQG